MKKGNIEVVLHKSTIVDDFEKLLEQFSNWIQFKREIKLLSILEGKKIEYTVDNIKMQKPIYGLLEDSINEIVSLKDISFIIRSLTFTIKENNVLGLRANIESVDSQLGKTIDSLIESEVDFSLKYKTDIKSEILYFYIYFPNLVK